MKLACDGHLEVERSARSVDAIHLFFEGVERSVDDRLDELEACERAEFAVGRPWLLGRSRDAKKEVFDLCKVGRHPS
jgi:hypothetical protein